MATPRRAAAVSDRPRCPPCCNPPLPLAAVPADAPAAVSKAPSSHGAGATPVAAAAAPASAAPMAAAAARACRAVRAAPWRLPSQ